MLRPLNPLVPLLVLHGCLLTAETSAQSILVPHGSQNGGTHVAAFDPFDGTLQTASFINLAEGGAPILRGIQAVNARGDWWVTDNSLETAHVWSEFGATYLAEELGSYGDVEGAVRAFGSAWICTQGAPFTPGTLLEVTSGAVIEHTIYLDAPAGVCEHQGELIVTGGNDVVRVDPSTGDVIATIYTTFAQQGFNQPISRPSTGNLLIARSATLNDIVEMDLSGNIVNEFDVDAALGLFAPRACFELGNGNFLISWSDGISVVDPALTTVEHVLLGVTPWYFTLTGDVTLGQNYCGPAVPNSTGRSGRIAATGATQAAIGQLRLCAVDLPSGSTGYFICSQTQGFIAQPGGSTGNVCLGGSVGRFVQQVQSTLTVSYIDITVDTTSIPQPNTVLPLLAGQTWNFQLWHRDSVGGQATSNFTDAVSVAFN